MRGPTDKALRELIAIRGIFEVFRDCGVKADPMSLEADQDAVLDLAAKCVGYALQRNISKKQLFKMMNRHLKVVGAEIREPTRQ
jgi:hypothetical protein